MHIPNHMLEGNICPITTIISAAGILAAAIVAFRVKHKPFAARFAAVTAFIFSGQMMNFPVQNGTSGHLLGAALAVALLGIPFGILSIAIVVTIQCLVFSDGGTVVLGANILNMALIGAGAAGLTHYIFLKKMKYIVSLCMVSWLSIVMAALACSVELSLAGTIPFFKVAGSMISTHMIIGIGEAVITMAACCLFSAEPVTVYRKESVVVPLSAAGVIAVLLSPFASGFPDGLEAVAVKYNFFHESAPALITPLSDYTVSFISNKVVSGGLAGFAGVFFTFLSAWGVAMFLNLKPKTYNL